MRYEKRPKMTAERTNRPLPTCIFPANHLSDNIMRGAGLALPNRRYPYAARPLTHSVAALEGRWFWARASRDPTSLAQQPLV